MTRKPHGGEKRWRVLESVEDVTPDVESDIEDCLGWFDDKTTMGTEEFIDRLCDTYGGSGHYEGDYDVSRYDSAAVRHIMKIARRLRREAQG